MPDSDDEQRTGRGKNLVAALRQPTTALLVAAVLIPAALFGLAIWANYRETLSQAAVRVDRTTRILEEHAVKVLETNRLVVGQVKQRLRTMNWSSPTDQLELHDLLDHLQTDFDQVTTLTITDAAGRMRASGRTYPSDPSVSFADRDWFKAIKNDPSKPIFISRSYSGRQSGLPVFNLAMPYFTPAHVFEGVVAESIDRGYFESFYRDVEPDFDHAVTLVRADGEILASEPPSKQSHLPLDGRWMMAIRGEPSGSFVGSSRLDPVDRLYAYRKVGTYPIYVRFGISRSSALRPWRRNLLTYGIVAALASAVLAIMATFAARQTRREREASRRWRAAAAELAARAIERERVEEQLRQLQKMEAIGRLTGGIAHDFNNLLTVVIGNLELSQRALDDAGPRVNRLIAQALDGASRAATLTHRLLAFSRQQPLQPKQVQADQLISGMSDLLRVTLGETVGLEMVFAKGLWPVLVDPNQLESALLNLVVNSRDAMPDGGQVTIEASNVMLDTTYVADNPGVIAGPFLHIAVVDTGAGMSPDILAKVFEPFFTTKPIGKGTGLGLSQVYGFAQQSGGHVALRSDEGHGTTIDIFLPMSTQPAPQARDMPRPAPAPGVSRGETILVVEDEDLVRQFTVDALRGEGYVVYEAADGDSALVVLDEQPDIDLLFTDVVLKGRMNGRALADLVSKKRGDLPVLYTTGYSSDAEIQDGQDIDVLTKPFSALDLAARVRAALDSVREPVATNR